MKSIAIVTGFLILALVSSLAAGPIPTTTGSIRIDTVMVEPGDDFAVEVRLENNSISLAGLQIPLQFDSEYLTVDSISFAGSMVPAGMLSTGHIDNGMDTLAIQIYPTLDSISSFDDAEGLLATIHGNVRGDAPLGTIPIDSIFDTGGLFWTAAAMTNELGILFLPSNFYGGAVVVSSPTDVEDDIRTGLPGQFALSQNYPNPFNPTTTIGFSLPRAGHTVLEIYNVLGQRVVTLVDRHLDAGHHQAEFNGESQPSGIYFYRISYAQGSQTRKMVLLK